MSLELHNLHYLKELLVDDTHLSSEELAVLEMLLDMNLIQLKEMYRYYAMFMENFKEVCPLLNIKLCGQLYTNVVRFLYQQCKCKTLKAYVENFFNSPCMEYFQCGVVSHLQDLYTSGTLQLSEDESSYIKLVISGHCKGVYRNNMLPNIYDINNTNVSYTKTVPTLIIIIGTYVILSWLGTRYRNFHLTITSIFMGFVFIIIPVTNVMLSIYELAIKSAHHPTLRVLEITSKLVCHYEITVIYIFILISCIYFTLYRFLHIINPTIENFTLFISPLIFMLCFIIYIYGNSCRSISTIKNTGGGFSCTTIDRRLRT